MRVDLLMVERGLASSRTRAQEMIASGRVFVVSNGKKRPVSKASQKIDPDEETLQIEGDGLESRFVSRGGLKLQGALERVRLNVKGYRVLDIGISTGGFTDCLLQAGASSVIGVDVGHDQLAPTLRRDPRVLLIEGINARDLSKVPLIEHNGGRKFDLIVADVSFISLTLVLPELIQYLKETAPLLALVKPQFEVGRDGLGKGGIVKDPSRFAEVEEKIRKACAANALSVEDYFASPIEGTDGNREFFVFARPAQLQLAGFDFGSVTQRV